MNEVSFAIVSAVKEIKAAILTSQSRVAADANAEMLALYFRVGHYVAQRIKHEKWGSGVIDAISNQLQKEMPGLRGFSGRSIHKMRHFYEIWGRDAILPSVTAILDLSGAPIVPSETAQLAEGVSATEFMSLSFSHHTEIIDRLDKLDERLFYIRETARNHWNVRQLRDSIKRDDFRHRGMLASNFAKTIRDTALAKKTLGMFRDEYLLDFVNLDDSEATGMDDVDERVVEHAIVANIRKFIMDFGRDFSFVGNQYRVEIEGHEHFIDLLFFNRELNSLVAVELKMGAFKPIYLGQLQLYLQALDDTVRKPHENASVGIILCQSADRPYVEYAVRDFNKPMGVATYRTADEMPDNLKRALPPIDELRRQLSVKADDADLTRRDEDA